MEISIRIGCVFVGAEDENRWHFSMTINKSDGWNMWRLLKQIFKFETLDINKNTVRMDESKCDCNPLPMEGMHDKMCSGWVEE